MEKTHIDDVQTQTVDEHFEILLNDKSVIDSDAPDVTSNDLPDWYDKNLYKEGQNYYKRNTLSLIAIYTVGLILVFAVDTILKVLVYTKRSSSVYLAYKRYTETLLHIHNINTCDPNNTNSEWYKSINAVRRHHKMGSKKSKTAGLGEISQRDMALTQYGFMALVFITPQSFGLCNTLEEDEAYNHVWRVNGYMLGIPHRFNLCRKNVKETTELCKKIKELYTTYLKNAPTEFYEISKYSLKALRHINITTTEDSFMSFAYELYNLPYKTLDWVSWLSAKYHEWLFYLCLVPYVRVVARTYTYYLAKLLIWSAQNFPIFAWMRWGKDNVRLNLYPKYEQL